MAVAGKLIPILRDAMKQASAPVEQKTQGVVLGNDIPDRVIVPATRGGEKLNTINIDFELPITGGTVTAVAGQTNTDFLSQVEIRADGQQVVDTSSSSALREFIRIFWDKAPVDTVLSAAGTARTRIQIPVSGSGRRNIDVKIRFANFAEVYSAGTPGSPVCTISARYGPVDIPNMILYSNEQTFTATGKQLVDAEKGPQDNLGWPSYLQVIGDGTLVLDDIAYINANGVKYWGDKQPRIKAYFQDKVRETLTANGLVYAETEPLLPISERDRFELDVTTAGTFQFLGLFAIDDIAIQPVSVVGQMPTANLNDASQTPDIIPQEQARDVRQGTQTPNQRLGRGQPFGIIRQGIGQLVQRPNRRRLNQP